MDLEKSDSFKSSATDPFRYPVINTGDKKVDSLINHDFKNRMTDNEFENESVEAAMQNWSKNGIGYLDYEVSFNENDLLSFQVTSEFFGSYLTRWTTYFNYDLSTGKPLQLDDVIKMSKPFTARLKKDKNEVFAKAKKELQTKNLDKNAKFDLRPERWALENYTACEQNEVFKDFILYDTHITIIQDCELPNAIKSMSVFVRLDYYYDEIANELKADLK
jgi:hypothetical protein